MFGTWEILLIVAVILLFFGATRIPALAEALGRGVRSFRRGVKGDTIDVSPKIDASPKTEELPKPDEQPENSSQ